MEQKSLSPASLQPIQSTSPITRSIGDSDLARLAASSPVASYVRSLTTDVSRGSVIHALNLIGEVVAPEVVPPSSGRGRRGNSALRFQAVCALPFHHLRAERLSEIRSALLRRSIAPATANRCLNALRGVLTQCWQQGLIDGDALARAKSALRSINASALPVGRHIPKIEVATLFATIARSANPAATRDAAILALLCCGLRRNEVATLKVSDYEGTTGRLVVTGKRLKQRQVFLVGGAKSAVQAWLNLRGMTECPFLFLQVNKAGTVITHGMTAQAIYLVVQKRTQQAGINANCHDFRRSLVGEMFSSGVDVAVISKVVGHTNPSVTLRYDQRGDEVQVAAMTAVQIPFVPCNR
jgi:site-specific recombinase XerD